jgi:hypothetical protein
MYASRVPKASARPRCRLNLPTFATPLTHSPLTLLSRAHTWGSVLGDCAQVCGWLGHAMLPFVARCGYQFVLTPTPTLHKCYCAGQMALQARFPSVPAAGCTTW